MSRYSHAVAKTAVLVLAISSLAVDGVGAESVPTGPDTTAGGAAISAELQALIDGAAAEGALVLNWGHGAIAQNIERWVDAFNTTYGLDTALEFTPQPAMPQNLGELIQTSQAGRPAPTDVFIGTHTHIMGGGPNGADVFQPVDWQALNPDLSEGIATVDNAALMMLTQILGFAYNTNEFAPDELPRTTADIEAIEKPIASTPYAAGFAQLAAEELLGSTDAVIAHVEALDPEGLIGCSDMQRISSGEFAGFWISCSHNIVEIAKSQGAPVDQVIIEDAAVLQHWYLAIPKHAQNPNTATLFANWLVTPEGQDLIFESEFTDNHLLEGSQSGEQIAQYQEETGVEFFDTTYEWLVENPEINEAEYVDRLDEIMAGG